MDAKSHKLRVAIKDYLDEIQGSSHKPISKDAISALNNAADVMEKVPDEDLSPGQKSVADSAPGYYERVQYEPETEKLSPGERASLEASIPGND
jgi:hypothetical protein